MLTLALHTASSIESIVLFSSKKIFAETIWKSASDESEKLLPNISLLLKKAHLSFQDLTRIIVVKGPGPFSAVRIGVTVVNTLAFIRKIPLYSIDSKTFWHLRAPSKNTILLLHAGGNFIYCKGGDIRGDIFTIEKAMSIFLHSHIPSFIFFGDITQEEMRLFKKMKRKSWKFIEKRYIKTFGEVISQLKLSRLRKEKVVAPIYWKAPNITYPTP